MSTELKNFSILNVTSVPLTAGATSLTTDLSNTSGQEDIMLINLSVSDILYVRTGKDDVEADATSMPVLPGEKGVYTKGQSQATITKLAYFAPVGSVDFILVQGTGS